MTPIELLKQSLVAAEHERDIADQEDRYARMAHSKSITRFGAAVDNVKALKRAIEVLEAVEIDI